MYAPLADAGYPNLLLAGSLRVQLELYCSSYGNRDVGILTKREFTLEPLPQNTEASDPSFILVSSTSDFQPLTSKHLTIPSALHSLYILSMISGAAFLAVSLTLGMQIAFTKCEVS